MRKRKDIKSSYDNNASEIYRQTNTTPNTNNNKVEKKKKIHTKKTAAIYTNITEVSANKRLKCELRTYQS